MEGIEEESQGEEGEGGGGGGGQKRLINNLNVSSDLESRRKPAKNAVEEIQMTG